MKILHLVTGLTRGGAETMLARLAPRLGGENIVVSLMDEGALGPELCAAGIPVFSLGMPRGRFSLKGLGRLRRIIREEEPDILQTWLYHADLIGLATCAFDRDLALVWGVQCSDMDAKRYSWQLRTIRWILARASRLPKAIIVNSKAGEEFHRRLGYRPIHWEFIPNGCDTSYFRPDPVRRAAARRSLGLSDDTLVVGMVARVDPMKDYANFLAAAVQIASLRRDIGFIVVGRGTDELDVPSALAGRVIALGERNDVSSVLLAFDVFALSSAFGEGSPNVIVEAMASGVPCVATNVGDSASIVGDTGVIVPPRDATALREAVLYLLERREVMGAAARQRVLKEYSIESITKRYQSFYQTIMARRVRTGAVEISP